jgi:hypothetical protein
MDVGIAGIFGVSVTVCTVKVLMYRFVRVVRLGTSVNTV